MDVLFGEYEKFSGRVQLQHLSHPTALFGVLYPLFLRETLTLEGFFADLSAPFMEVVSILAPRFFLYATCHYAINYRPFCSLFFSSKDVMLS